MTRYGRLLSPRLRLLPELLQALEGLVVGVLAEVALVLVVVAEEVPRTTDG
jgi:hypothetical protein